MRPLCVLLLHQVTGIVGVERFSQKEHAGSEAAKKSLDLNQQWFDWLTIPPYNVMCNSDGLGRAPAHCHRDWQSYKVVLKSNHKSMHDRFMKDPVYRASHLKINWTDETCLKIDELSQQNHHSVATLAVRESLALHSTKQWKSHDSHASQRRLPRSTRQVP